MGIVVTQLFHSFSKVENLGCVLVFGPNSMQLKSDNRLLRYNATHYNTQKIPHRTLQFQSLSTHSPLSPICFYDSSRYRYTLTCTTSIMNKSYDTNKWDG